MADLLKVVAEGNAKVIAALETMTNKQASETKAVATTVAGSDKKKSEDDDKTPRKEDTGKEDTSVYSVKEMQEMDQDEVIRNMDKIDRSLLHHGKQGWGEKDDVKV